MDAGARSNNELVVKSKQHHEYGKSAANTKRKQQDIHSISHKHLDRCVTEISSSACIYEVELTEHWPLSCSKCYLNMEDRAKQRYVSGNIFTSEPRIEVPVASCRRAALLRRESGHFLQKPLAQCPSPSFLRQRVLHRQGGLRPIHLLRLS